VRTIASAVIQVAFSGRSIVMGLSVLDAMTSPISRTRKFALGAVHRLKIAIYVDRDGKSYWAARAVVNGRPGDRPVLTFSSGTVKHVQPTQHSFC
jgi:hypothetical protein